MSPSKLYARAQKVDSLGHASLLPSNNSLADALQYALENSAANGLPSITISPLQGQYLAIQSQLISAKNILEIGTLGGYSTIWFASTGAKVTSLEIDPQHRDVALQNVKHAGLEDSVDVILGPALDTLPTLAKDGKKFDLVFIDADWGEQFDYFAHAVKLVRPNGCIYVDNVVREVLEGDAQAYESGKKETLFQKVGKLDGVQATLVSVVSSHKRHEDEAFDGFLLAVVKG
ncbi:hypothetical protein H2200_010529 [Cladophialophora chaetospira]|uniref:O-methyltransferase n=1 Tax=Cladophialophora chaetospira TaxID=386627 RepID=A0AA38X1N5_9EURO|nr:hypothetical protein H2200_010529 [Cladophialophora chaetospira]